MKKKISVQDNLFEKILKDFLEVSSDCNSIITEEELASRYGVGKTPVREALLNMKNQGFIISLPRKGYQARKLTFKEMQDYFTMRIILETNAVELAIPNIDENAKMELISLAKQEINNSKSDSVFTYMSLNYDLHLKIVELSNNRVLIETYKNIYLHLKRALYSDAGTHRVSSLAQEHSDLVDILISGNVEQCKEAIKSHLHKTWNRIVSL